MTANDFVTDYIMHDSLMEDVTILDGGKTIVITVDFAFWMQRDYKDREPETGYLKVTFSNVTGYSIPDNVNWDEISILETKLEGFSVKFALTNDSTDDYLEIAIDSDEILIEPVDEA